MKVAAYGFYNLAAAMATQYHTLHLHSAWREHLTLPRLWPRVQLTPSTFYLITQYHDKPCKSQLLVATYHLLNSFHDCGVPAGGAIMMTINRCVPYPSHIPLIASLDQELDETCQVVNLHSR